MALNLADLYAVRRVVVDRCTAAVTNYALYILGNVNATTEELAWAREAMRSPASYGEQTSYYLLNQPDFVNNGSDITDASLKGSVETAINAHFIAPAP